MLARYLTKSQLLAYMLPYTNSPPPAITSTKRLPLWEEIQEFIALYSNGRDWHCQQIPSGVNRGDYTKKRGPLTYDLIIQHWEGKISLAPYILKGPNKDLTNLVVFDFDTKEGHRLRLVRLLIELNIPFLCVTGEMAGMDISSYSSPPLSQPPLLVLMQGTYKPSQASPKVQTVPSTHDKTKQTT